jgi:hypothetical protein
VVYPETGNGGYRSVHTDVALRYDERRDTFLAGTHVVLSDLATQCLTSLSLDFERRELGQVGGPDLHVQHVLVNGIPASWRFVQPTYPGDPKGADDPDPRAHQMSQTNPVGGPHDNPLPPACTPELKSGRPGHRFSRDGEPCPANKLVVTPRKAIPAGAAFTVRVAYTGRPGLHHDGDGSTEGWFRVPGGSAMSTEPVASEDWMPLNDHPSAKPTYDFEITTNAGKTAICNGQLKSVKHHSATPEFPGGSATWHWSAPMPIPSYLALTMVGDYHLTSRVAADGLRYYQAHDTHIPARLLKHDVAVMRDQPDITDFEARFNGPFPFSSDGVVASAVQHGAAIEEMETMIVFTNGYVNRSTLYHENMHQWWGDNVSEAGYEMTFFKEGLATLGQVFASARQAQGRRSAADGAATFDGRMVAWFNHVYASDDDFWTRAPSHPAAYDLFSGSATYTRPAAAYVALWQILGRQRFITTLRAIQHIYGGLAITERQLERQFGRFLPNRTPACEARLGRFFTQWFDTAYRPGGGVHRPRLTGPGLHGGGFYGGSCPKP